MVVIRTHGFTELKSGDDLRYERAVDIREPHIATTKAIRQLGMIHSQKVQHRRVQVMGGNRLLHRPVAKLVCQADYLPTTDPGTCHPSRHGAGIVVSAHTPPTLEWSERHVAPGALEIWMTPSGPGRSPIGIPSLGSLERLSFDQRKQPRR